jgi:uncharacterized protein (TIGR03118 family)
MTNIVSNRPYLPVVANTQDPNLIDPFGMVVIDQGLWVADHGASVITHYSSNGTKLAPNKIVPLVSLDFPELNRWASLIYSNIVGLALNNTNILIALGLPVGTFIEFRNRIARIVNEQFSFISPEAATAIHRVYLDYVNAVLPPQTLNDILIANRALNSIDRKNKAAPVSTLIANTTLGFPISLIEPGRQIRTFASYLIAVTTNGLIIGYNPLFMENQDSGIVAVDRTETGGIYTGAAIVNNNLYICDLFTQEVLVFNQNFEQVGGYNFTDEDGFDPLPFDYVPYNIININNLLYVVYGKINSQGDSIVQGPGHGYISIFNPDGSFVKRFVSRGALNRPYSIVIAPTSFGSFSNLFLVGNQGDGLILAYNSNGTFVSPVGSSITSTPIVIAGLNGLATDGTAVYISSSNVDKFGYTDGLITSLIASNVN